MLRATLCMEEMIASLGERGYSSSHVETGIPFPWQRNSYVSLTCYFTMGVWVLNMYSYM